MEWQKVIEYLLSWSEQQQYLCQVTLTASCFAITVNLEGHKPYYRRSWFFGIFSAEKSWISAENLFCCLSENPVYSASTWSVSKALRYSTYCQGITQFYLHTVRFIRKRNELYLPLPSQQQLLIYRSWSDGRPSRPWCRVASAEPPDCKFGTLPHSH